MCEYIITYENNRLHCTHICMCKYIITYQNNRIRSKHTVCTCTLLPFKTTDYIIHLFTLLPIKTTVTFSTYVHYYRSKQQTTLHLCHQGSCNVVEVYLDLLSISKCQKHSSRGVVIQVAGGQDLPCPELRQTPLPGRHGNVHQRSSLLEDVVTFSDRATVFKYSSVLTFWGLRGSWPTRSCRVAMMLPSGALLS